MVRTAPPTQLPSVGISLGESGSDVFQITAPLRSSLSIFCEGCDFTQYAKNLLIAIVVPLLLVISILSSLGFGFVIALSETAPQIDSDGATDVAVGVSVFVGVKVDVNVDVKVGVKVGVVVRVFVGVDVLIGVNVLVGKGVFVGGFVSVGVGVTVLVGVEVGSTTSVYVGGIVGEAVRVIVGVKMDVGVDVIALWISLCACASETGLISAGEQYCPVIVQAIVSSSPVIA
jgi:hypothetical protein